MIISCPSCTARFKVASDAIGSDGRVVKCSKCGHTWQARAEDDEATGAGAPVEAAAPAAPAPPPEPEPESEPEIEFDSVPEPAPETAAAEEEPPPPPPPPPQADGGPVSSAALDAAVEGLVGASETDESEPEQAEPEPEPETAEAEPEEEPEPVPEPPGEAVPPPPEPPPTRKELASARKGGAGRVAAWAFVILVFLVAGIGAGVYLARERLVALFPPLNLVLIQIGIGVPHLGEGLALASPNAELDEQGLRISGFIENRRGEILEIPLLRGALCDANSQEIYVWTFRADDTRVLPGERIGYETLIQDAPAGAKDIRIGFTTEAEAAAESTANGTGKPGACK